MLGGRPMAAVALLVLAVAGAWWMASRHSAPVMSDRTASTGVAGAPNETAIERRGDSPVPRRRGSPVAGPGGETTASNSNDPSPITMTVQCLDDRTGDPLPGTRVLFQAACLGDGRIVASDDTGTAAIQLAGDEKWLSFSSADPLWRGDDGTFTSPGRPPCELRLNRVPRVLVVDDKGSPCANVDVHLLEVHSESSLATEEQVSTTDDRGIAYLSEAAGLERDPGGRSASRFAVALDIPNTGKHAPRLDPTSYEPLRIVLPRMGEVTIRAEDCTGAPLANVSVHLWPCPLESGARFASVTTDESGVALFRQAALNKRLRAELPTLRGTITRSAIEFHGPTHEEVEVAATLTAQAPPSSSVAGCRRETVRRSGAGGRCGGGSTTDGTTNRARLPVVPSSKTASSS